MFGISTHVWNQNHHGCWKTFFWPSISTGLCNPSMMDIWNIAGSQRLKESKVGWRITYWDGNPVFEHSQWCQGKELATKITSLTFLANMDNWPYKETAVQYFQFMFPPNPIMTIPSTVYTNAEVSLNRVFLYSDIPLTFKTTPDLLPLLLSGQDWGNHYGCSVEVLGTPVE